MHTAARALSESVSSKVCSSRRRAVLEAVTRDLECRTVFDGPMLPPLCARDCNQAEQIGSHTATGAFAHDRVSRQMYRLRPIGTDLSSLLANGAFPDNGQATPIAYSPNAASPNQLGLVRSCGEKHVQHRAVRATHRLVTIDEFASYCQRTGRKLDRKNRARMNPRPTNASKVERQHEVRIGGLVRVRRPIGSSATAPSGHRALLVDRALCIPRKLHR